MITHAGQSCVADVAAARRTATHCCADRSFTCRYREARKATQWLWNQWATRTQHGRRPPTATSSASADYELLWSLSFTLTAAAWRRIGGFYDRFRGYGAEDTDFALTARAAGVPMRWVGGAHAFHQFHPVSIPR